MPTDAPKWQQPAKKQMTGLANRFKNNLTVVSERLADSDRVEAVSIRHVDEAHTALARSGLSRAKWFRRTEFVVGLGCLVFGAAFSAPGFFIGFFLEESPKRAGITLGLVIAMAAIGAAFAVSGWRISGSKIPAPPPNPERRRWACWPWTECSHSNQKPCKSSDAKDSCSVN